MSDFLKYLAVDNSLLSAFKSLKEQGTPCMRTKDISEQYSKYFQTAEQNPNLHNRYFERFSLVDPTIRVILTSSTKTIR